MPRTSKEAVSDIIEVDTDLAIRPFIQTASVVVDWLDSVDTDNELSAAELLEIETWLAAHFYAHRDQLFASKTTGRASATFQGKTGMGLSSTIYGQTAMFLDSTGQLAKRSKEAELGGRRIASLTWMGTEPEDLDVS